MDLNPISKCEKVTMKVKWTITILLTIWPPFWKEGPVSKLCYSPHLSPLIMKVSFLSISSRYVIFCFVFLFLFPKCVCGVCTCAHLFVCVFLGGVWECVCVYVGVHAYEMCVCVREGEGELWLFRSLWAVWWRDIRIISCWWTLTAVFAVCQQYGEEVWDVDEHWLPFLQFVSSMVTSYGILMNTDCFCSLWAVWWKAMRRSWQRTAGSTRAGSLLLPETRTGGWHSTCWRTFSRQVCQTRQHCWIHFLPTSSSHECLTSKLSV